MSLTRSQNRAIGQIKSYITAARPLTDGNASVPDVPHPAVIAAANQAFNAFDNQATASGYQDEGTPVTDTFGSITDPTNRLRALVLCMYGPLSVLASQVPAFADEFALVSGLLYLLYSV